MRRDAAQIYSLEPAELAFAKHCCQIAHVVGVSLAKYQTASPYLKQLAEIGILRESHVVARRS